MQNYKGNINAIFYDFLSVDDGFSAGEKLTAIEKLLPRKKLFYATDKEIYEAMEKYVNTPIEKDEPFEKDTDFAGFVEVMFEDNTKQTVFGIGRYYSK